MTDRRFLGVVEVDSGALLIGDPLYVLPSAERGRTGVDYQAVIDAPESPSQPLGGQPVLLIQQFGGDGTFPVFAEYEDGEVVRFVVELVEPDDA